MFYILLQPAEREVVLLGHRCEFFLDLARHLRLEL